MEDKYHAKAPELSVDLIRLSQLCTYMERREQKYRIAYIVLGVGLLFLTFVGFTSIPFLSLCAVLLASAIQYRKFYEERYILAKYFTKDNYEPATVANKFQLREYELYSVSSKDKRELIVYKDFLPFVGAGIDLGGWSFVLDVSKLKDQANPKTTPLSFQVDDLYKAVEKTCMNLGVEDLLVKEYYYVNGKNLRDKPDILPGFDSVPLHKLPSAVLVKYSKQNDAPIRKYKWIRVHCWKGEIVVSFFVHAAIKGKSLFVESRKFLLPPLMDKYRKVDQLKPWNQTTQVWMAIESLLIGPLSLLGAIPYAMSKLDLSTITEAIAPHHKDETQWRNIKSDPQYDYGAGRSFRESLSGTGIVSYFQWLDVRMYTKTLEHQILDTIVAFLDEHNIDTSEIKERQTVILNSGVMVQGGNVTAESLAVGSGAQAITGKNPISPIRSAQE